MKLVHRDRRLQSVRIRPYGERGYLLDGFNDEVRLLLDGAIQFAPPDRLEEYVWGYENVLLLFLSPVPVLLVENWLQALESESICQVPLPRHVEIAVRYDGPDLEAVARHSGLSIANVVALHSAPEYRVRMMGFAPGFPYLDGLDARLHMERQDSPRNRIEPGMVAIGGTHTGIYSVPSPGGWHLIGRTDCRLFQPNRARGAVYELREVFKLAVGDVVKFTAI
jgi:KipI family sensor histidine kinase inhibitor